MKTTRKLLTVSAVVAAAWLCVPSQASAAGGRKSVLEGEPIVRKKLQLRKFRFQLTPYVGMSLSQPFVHMGYVGARAGIHFADWIGVRAGFGYGVVNVDSALLRAVNGGGLPVGIAPGQPDNSVSGGPMCNAGAPCRPLAELDNPAPLRHDFQAGLTRAQWQSSVDVVFTPFAGKLGLFSAAFTNYDIYVFGGLGLVNWANHYDQGSTAELNGLETNPDSPAYCTDPVSGLDDECILHPVDPDTGVKIGASFGGGVHLFITNFIAMNLEVQDIVTSNNLAGLNTTVSDIPPLVDRGDRDVLHNVTLQLGAKIYIPFKAKRSK